MDNTVGVLIAIASSCLGGSAAAVTRYLVSDADPATLAILRWCVGFVVALPVLGHVATRTSAREFEEAQMPLRDAGALCKRELRQTAVRAPPA